MPDNCIVNDKNAHLPNLIKSKDLFSFYYRLIKTYFITEA